MIREKNKRTFIFRVSISLILFGILAVTGCKDNSGGSEPPPPEPTPTEYTKTITPTDSESGETLTQAALFDADTDERLGTGATDLTREEGERLSLRAEADGHNSATEQLNFTDGTPVEITLERAEPETETVTVEPRLNGATYSAAEVFDAGSGEKLGDGKTALERELGTELTVRITGPDVKTKEETLTFNETKTVVVPLEETPPETATVTVDPTLDGSTYSQAEVFDAGTSEKLGDGKTEIEREVGTELTIRIEGPDVETTEQALTFDESKTVTVQLERKEEQPACSDGVDNDGDGKTDEADSGCVDADGNYDPEDDVEKTRVRQITLFGNKGDTTLVSGAKDEQELLFVSRQVNDLPSFTQMAVSITVKFEVLVEETQTGEEFALRFNTGPDDDNLSTTNVTAIVPDEGQDGWKDVTLTDVTRDYFENGTAYEVITIHACEVRESCPTDGDDDVLFRTPQKAPDFIIEIEYEPEETSGD